jgi:hypothetical protein
MRLVASNSVLAGGPESYTNDDGNRDSFPGARRVISIYCEGYD